MIKLGFIGDISFNNGFIQMKEQGVNPFIQLNESLKKCDLVIGNLECFVEGINENELKKPRIKTKLNTLEYLKDINVGVVSLANNHYYDNLYEGYKDTIEFLEKNNIKHCGTGINNDYSKKPVLLYIKGVHIAFISAVAEDTNPLIPQDSKIVSNDLTFYNLNNQIESIKNQVEYIILLLHWGGIYENGSFPSIEQVHLAHQLINIGATCIIGHHSHSLQPFDVHQGKLIFYSLGNFAMYPFAEDGHFYGYSNSSLFSALIILRIKEEIQLEEVVYFKYKNEVLQLISKPIQFKFINFVFSIFKNNSLFYTIYKMDYQYFLKYRQFFFSKRLTFNEKLSIIRKKLVSFSKLKCQIF